MAKKNKMSSLKERIPKERNRALALFEKYGGFIHGHTEFNDGFHSSGYVEKMNVLKYPKAMEIIAEELAELFADTRIDVVCGPVHIGAILGYSVANQLNVPFTLTYIEVRTGETFFHRAFHPKSERLLFVDDFIVSGKNVSRNLSFFDNEQINCVGIAAIGAKNPPDTQIPIRFLFETPFEKISPRQCRQCLNHVPLTYRNVRE
ncbi:MAG: Orotate phosphoribosyltransferase [Candidatus Curtissbacteria bacterium GW2011_GWA1_41_11]|uniref:Orotate phosphoribosyltransferase n=1 Tax=Candidatus Curtissbacteria bacterium GW2011_GWA1_41_11 TaxID=1618409 RepID=A0A0G0UGZ9_9BACT|nr:MAG: Orotate phosphoribosyltransferase [Candidatus Curtissbacteria bacterium GW2011_GWA1_41_11]